MSFRIINNRVVSIDVPEISTKNVKTDKTLELDFKNVLDKQIKKNEEIKLSGHAIERLKSRNINLDVNDMKKLSDAIEKAGNKGARESLLFYRDVAFIASIKNRTIITALDKESSKDNVFTNIDSAVIIS